MEGKRFEVHALPEFAVGSHPMGRIPLWCQDTRFLFENPDLKIFSAELDLILCTANIFMGCKNFF